MFGDRMFVDRDPGKLESEALFYAVYFDWHMWNSRMSVCIGPSYKVVMDNLRNNLLYPSVRHMCEWVQIAFASSSAMIAALRKVWQLAAP